MAAPSAPDPIPMSPLAPDLEAVRAFIFDMVTRGAVAGLVAAILALLTRMRDLNGELLAKLAQKRRAKPPNEALRRLQLELPFAFAKVDPANKQGAPQPGAENAAIGKSRKARKRTTHGRSKLPDHLQRIPTRRDVEPEHRNCPHCSGQAKTVGYKATEKLDLVPAYFVVRVEEREVVACQRCHHYFYCVPKQDEVLDRGMLGEELLVEALVDHYRDAVPWERMERNAREHQVPLAATTLARTVGRVLDLFDPIVHHIFLACVRSQMVALDATSIPVLDREHPAGIHTGSLWLLEGDHRYAFFAYAPTGHAEHLAELLRGYELVRVMCDGSATNNVAQSPGALRAGCNAHSRRKLIQALREGDARAVPGIEIYAAIFHVDSKSVLAREDPIGRFSRRLLESTPLVEKLRLWMETQLDQVEPKSTLGKALNYMKRQWQRITEFLRDPLIDLTNNEVERDLRAWVLDRKTWLFCGSEESARRAAAALTLITTCRKLGIDPKRYLKDALRKLLAGEKDLTALLPETFATNAQLPNSVQPKALPAAA